MSPVDTRRAASDLNRALLVDMERLPDRGWQRQSDCTGWSVGAVVVHLAQVAELLSDSLARGRDGDPGPPARAAEGIPAWRAWRAGELTRRTAQEPTEVLEQDRASHAELEREFDRIATAPSDARAWHPAGAQPLAWFLDQWLFELALHDWDIRVASDSRAEIRPPARGAFARTLPARLGRGFGGADNPELAGRYRVELEGEAPFAWVARVGEGRVETESAEAAASDVTIRTDPPVLAVVMTNRRPVDDFEGSGRWRAAGDTTRAAAFARAFKSY